MVVDGAQGSVDAGSRVWVEEVEGSRVGEVWRKLDWDDVPLPRAVSVSASAGSVGGLIGLAV